MLCGDRLQFRRLAELAWLSSFYSVPLNYVNRPSNLGLGKTVMGPYCRSFTKKKVTRWGHEYWGMCTWWTDIGDHENRCYAVWILPSRGTIDNIFIVRQLHEKYLGKSKKPYNSFIKLSTILITRESCLCVTCIWQKSYKRIFTWGSFIITYFKSFYYVLRLHYTLCWLVIQ